MSLVKKSIFTSLSKSLNILLNLILQIILTPIIVTILGSHYYGIYTIITRLQSYMALADLRPSGVLRYKLASLQNSQDINNKNEYVATATIVSIISIPFIIFIGYLISVLFLRFTDLPEKDYSLISTSIILLSLIISSQSLLSIPEAIVRGNNLEYKLIYADIIKILTYGILVYYFLNINFGILGIIYAIAISILVESFLKFILQLKYFPQYKLKKPAIEKLKEFTKNSGWYMGSSFSNQVLNSIDVFLILILFNTEYVTVYAISKMLMHRAAESFASVISGITSSVGHLITESRLVELNMIRQKLFRYGIILGFFIIIYFISFNEQFISLWTNEKYYVGNYTNIILALTSLLIIFTLNNEIFLDSLQMFKERTFVGIIAILISVIFSYIFSLELGIISIAIGFFISKFYQFVNYEYLINRKFRINIIKELIVNIKILICFFIIYVMFFFLSSIFIINSWFNLILISCLYLVVFMIITYIGLEKEEKNSIKKFIQGKVINVK